MERQIGAERMRRGKRLTVWKSYIASNAKRRGKDKSISIESIGRCARCPKFVVKFCSCRPAKPSHPKPKRNFLHPGPPASRHLYIPSTTPPPPKPSAKTIYETSKSTHHSTSTPLPSNILQIVSFRSCEVRHFRFLCVDV